MNAQREAIKQQHAIVLKNYITCQRVDLLCKNDIEYAVDNIYISGIHAKTHGFGNRSAIDVLQYLFQTYGHISPQQ
eukprot:4342457-Ditylum_brightwellii.AAC.1